MAEADSVVAKAAELSVADVSSIQHAFSVAGRVVIQKLLHGGRAFIGQSVVVGGWVKTGRDGEKGALAFLEVNDGSCTANLQVIVPSSVFDLSILTSTGASVLLRGTVKEPPEGKKQNIEVHATEVLFAGPSDAKTYPVAKTKLSLEFLRSVIHFRIRTNTIAAISRIRNTLAAATHEFFQKNGFLYVHSPLITSSDCEGAGEMFQVYPPHPHVVPHLPSFQWGHPSKKMFLILLLGFFTLFSFLVLTVKGYHSTQRCRQGQQVCPAYRRGNHSAPGRSERSGIGCEGAQDCQGREG